MICPGNLSIVAPDSAMPGDVQSVSLSGDGVPEAGVVWSDDVDGTFVGTGSTATWTVSPALAQWVAEDVAIAATVQVDGCEPVAVSTTVPVDWPENRRVVVIYNPAVERSMEVAEAYAALHDIPEGAVCGVASDTDPQSVFDLDGALWPAWVTEAQACIDAVGPQVAYVVPVYGVPLKVSGRIDNIDTAYGKATVSLDGLLAFGVESIDFTETFRNPLYRSGSSMNQTYDEFVEWGTLRENHQRKYPHTYAVARIDGNDADASLDLIERTRAAMEAVANGTLDGTVYVDGNRGDTPPTTDSYGSYESGEWNMWGTRYYFEEDGRYPVVWDGNGAEFGTAPAPEACPDALYYAGWYQYYHYNDAFTWTVGAIGGHLDSCSACDLRDVGDTDGDGVSNSTWAAAALARGITATFGAVNEPYVAGMPEYDQFFRYFGGGANFGAAAYESTTLSAWMMVWVGDPLYHGT
jgi:uncharacterized protein (TIGR03790 family)